MKTLLLLGLLMLSSCTSSRLNELPSQSTQSRLIALSSDGLKQRVIYETNDHIEAPNWSPGGTTIIFNKKDGLYKVAASGHGKAVRIPIVNSQIKLTP